MLNQETFNPSHTIDQRIIAVIEVLLVFIITFSLIWLAALLPIGRIAWMFLSYIIMITFPLLILIFTRRDLKAYGLNFDRHGEQINLTLAVLPVTLVMGAVTGWLLPELIPNAIVTWQGALILSILSILFLVWTAWILRKKPTIETVLPVFLCVIPLAQGSGIIPERIASFLFYLLLLGPGEEFLFRGYIQSRLNEAFGRPFRFWGVSWGWGLVIASLLFGCMHIFNRFNPFLGKFDLYVWWGVWTIFGGVIFGYVREKAGSILPTAILHGLPQAIASLMFGFFGVR